MFLPFRRPDKHASSLAAAMLVLVQALTGGAFLLALLTPAADQTFLIVAAVVFTLAFIGLWLYGRPLTLVRDSMAWVFSRRARPDPVQFDVTRRPVSFRRYGTQQPTTVDEVRDLKLGTTNNWVPSRSVSRARQR